MEKAEEALGTEILLVRPEKMRIDEKIARRKSEHGGIWSVAAVSRSMNPQTASVLGRHRAQSAREAHIRGIRRGRTGDRLQSAPRLCEMWCEQPAGESTYPPDSL